MGYKDFPARIKDPKSVAISDMITVIRYYDYKTEVEKYIADDMTLADIIIKGENFITVIAESGLHGTIYRYGSHGKYWEQIGTTCGYA